MTRLANIEKAGYFPIPPAATDLILTYIVASHAGHILDPCAGEGPALATLTRALNPEPYGVQLHEGRAQAGQQVVAEMTALSPDFSRYRDWPVMLQTWNLYRNRWCAAFWASEGFTVIPSVSWSTSESYDFCFLGLAQRSVVAVSAVGVHMEDALERYLFCAGFGERAERLAPTVALSYGPLPDKCKERVKVVVYPTRCEGIRQARKRAFQVQ